MAVVVGTQLNPEQSQEAKRKALVEQLLKILEKWGLACPVGFGGSDLGFAAFGGHEVW